MENLVSSNIGSNEFHNELELWMIENFTSENLNEVVNLIKGLSQYRIQNSELNKILYGTVYQNIDNFSVR